MERSLFWIRSNPQVTAVVAACLITGLVLTLLATSMARAGLSLRPILWFAGFLAIVGGPQAVVHLLNAWSARQPATADASRQGSPALPTTAASHRRLKPIPWAVVFGPKADPQLVVDAKLGLAALFERASEAKLSFSATGESALAARFSNEADAARALHEYGKLFAFTAVQGSDEEGWTARRQSGPGDWAHVVTAGSEFYAWTGPSGESVEANRERALGPLRQRYSAASAPAATAPSQAFSKRLTASPRILFAIVGLNVLAATFWFFKGSTWAARLDAANTFSPTPAADLRRHLTGLEQRSGAPLQVTSLPDGGIEVTWRYADARWFDFARAHRLTRTERLVLHLDEANRVVRVREYWGSFDASAAPHDLRVNWTLNTGIRFFATEHQRVFGAQLSPSGELTGEMSQVYTFNLQEMKRPFIDAVLGAGWRWQPIVWNAPGPFRWLTE